MIVMISHAWVVVGGQCFLHITRFCGVNVQFGEGGSREL
jgi:hypothetical protein